MILGMTGFTFFHVVISLIAIGSGLIVLAGMLSSRRLPGWTMLFLVTTIATSATGFGFQRDHLLPSHIVGIISLVVLVVAALAYYRFRLVGAWRWIYAATATLALYLNMFVLVVQLFQKVEPLHALAPTQAEPPFAIAQGVVLLAFVIAGFLALRKFHPRD